MSISISFVITHHLTFDSAKLTLSASVRYLFSVNNSFDTEELKSLSELADAVKNIVSYSNSLVVKLLEFILNALYSSL